MVFLPCSNFESLGIIWNEKNDGVFLVVYEDGGIGDLIAIVRNGCTSYEIVFRDVLEAFDIYAQSTYFATFRTKIKRTGIEKENGMEQDGRYHHDG
jgi:hypothetical protein